MAMSLGFITQHEIERIEKPATLANFYGPPSTTGSLRTSVPSTAAVPTPRFNETLPPSSRGERPIPKGYAKPLWYYRVDDHEREAWVCCSTTHSSEIPLASCRCYKCSVKSWAPMTSLWSKHGWRLRIELVRANVPWRNQSNDSFLERDLARQLIIRALDGLGESDRFRTILPSLDVDMDSLDNFINGFVIILLSREVSPASVLSSIQVPQIPVDGVFRPTSKRPKRRAPLRSVDENRPVQDTRTDEEVLAGKVDLLIQFSTLFFFFLVHA